MARKKAGLAPPEKPKKVRVSIDTPMERHGQIFVRPDNYLVMVEKTIEGEKVMVREGALPEAQSRAGVAAMPVRVQTKTVRRLTNDVGRRRTVGWIYRRTFTFEV